MNSEAAGGSIKILLLEDNPGDARLTKEALGESDIPVEVSLVENGVDAVAFLRREGEHAGAARPDLILLDLGLPGMDGRQVLEEIKADEDLRRIPVALLTTSTAEQDILRSYSLYAHSYLNKPVDPRQVLSVVADIRNNWLSLVRIPGRAPQASPGVGERDQAADGG